MINDKVVENGFGTFFTIGTLESGDSPKVYPIDREVYQNHAWTGWQQKAHELLHIILEHCRLWKQHAHSLHEGGDTTASMWAAQYGQTSTLLERAYQRHRLPNFAEDMSLRLGDIDTVARNSSTSESFPIYLILSRIDKHGTRAEYAPYPHSDYRRVFQTSSKEWAYPHTVLASGHIIPQLLTLAESIISCDWRGNAQQVLRCVEYLKQLPNKWMLGSAFFESSLGGSFGIVGGIALNKLKLLSLKERLCEVIYRMNTATILNRLIARVLAPNSHHMSGHWSPEQKAELEKFRCAKSEEKIEILLVGHHCYAPGTVSAPTITFDHMKFSHYRTWMQDLFEHGQDIFNTGHIRYFVPTRSQSDEMIPHLDPDFLMEPFLGPYDTCYCQACIYEPQLGTESVERLARLKQRRKDRVNAIHKIAEQVSLNGSKRVYNILEHLRSQGHYIPTEDDFLDFVQAESTMEKFKVFERLNEEKREQERWMTEPNNHADRDDAAE